MKLTKTQEFLMRYTKLGSGGFNSKELIEGGLGHLYHHKMRVGDVHRIVYKAFNEMYLIREFEIPHDAPYEVLSSVVKPFHPQNTLLSIQDVLESQIQCMLSFIYISRVDWLNETWK